MKCKLLDIRSELSTIFLFGCKELNIIWKRCWKHSQLYHYNTVTQSVTGEIYDEGVDLMEISWHVNVTWAISILHERIHISLIVYHRRALLASCKSTLYFHCVFQYRIYHTNKDGCTPFPKFDLLIECLLYWCRYWTVLTLHKTTRTVRTRYLRTQHTEDWSYNLLKRNVQILRNKRLPATEKKQYSGHTWHSYWFRHWTKSFPDHNSVRIFSTMTEKSVAILFSVLATCCETS
jgi:hypothetical protein